MKYLSLIFAVLLFVGCDGEQGPVGPEGPPGPVGQAFEVEANFNESNDYAQFFSFPNNIEVLDTDIVAVYLLYEVDEETGNDVWQQLPASFFFEDGQFQYSFDHTLADVQLFLQGNIDFSTLGPDYTENQIFRVAILPVDYVQSNNINMKNIEEVMQAVDQTKIERLPVLQQ